MRHYSTVIFDCDSTLSALEGIEQLSHEHRDRIEALTAAAMRGEVPLEEVYGRRLDLIRPSRASVETLIPAYVDGLVDDAVATVAGLRACGVEVRVVSGGLLPAVAGLGRHLGLDDHAVSAVPLHFHEDGAYAGYDEAAPPARAGGKAEVVRRWKEDGLGSPVMFVGDGATDLEARGQVDLFVAYAGVVERPAVVAEAPVVIRSRSLAPIVPLALGGEAPDDGGGEAPGHGEGSDGGDPDGSTRAGVVYRRGKALIDQGMVEWR